MTVDLGTRIRAARTDKGMSLRATAAEAAISPSLLSQVETGKVQPSVSTLYAIVNALGLSVDDVLIRQEPAVRQTPRIVRTDPVQRSEDAPEIVMENGVIWRALAVMDSADGIDALHVTYQPGGASSIDGTHMRHPGVEHGYIIRGELTLKIDFDTHLLRAGDSFCFDPMRPHRFVNETDEVAEGVWFVVGSPRDAEPRVQDADAVVRSAVDVLSLLGRVPGRGEG